MLDPGSEVGMTEGLTVYNFLYNNYRDAIINPLEGIGPFFIEPALRVGLWFRLT
jgi:hypothetical protein